MKVLGRRWFTESTGSIGIVLVELDRKDMQHFDSKVPVIAFIGSAEGNNEDEDVNRIILWGAKFPVDAAMMLV